MCVGVHSLNVLSMLIVIMNGKLTDDDQIDFTHNVKVFTFQIWQYIKALGNKSIHKSQVYSIVTRIS